MNNLRSVFLSVWCLCLVCRTVLAEPVLLLTEHLPPYQIVGQGMVTGSAAEITQKVFHYADVEYEMAVFSWTDAYNIAQRKQNACLYSTSRIPERESTFAWIGQINSLSTAFYGSVNRDININSVEEAKNYRVAAIKYDVSHQFLVSKGFEEGKNLYVTHTHESLLDLLDRNNRHIDLILLNPELLEYRITDKRKLSRYLEVLQVEELVLYHYLACNIDADPQLLQRLRISFKELEEQGVLQSIRDKWGIPGVRIWGN